jgi:hypothetical protein
LTREHIMRRFCAEVVPVADGAETAVTAWPAVIGLPLTFLAAWMHGFWSVGSWRSASEAHSATREKTIETRVRRFSSAVAVAARPLLAAATASRRIASGIRSLLVLTRTPHRGEEQASAAY